MFHQYHHTRCIPLEHPFTLVAPKLIIVQELNHFLHLHIDTVLLLHRTFFNIKHLIGGTVYHLPYTIQLTGAILNDYFVYVLSAYNCIVYDVFFFLYACFVMSPARKNGFSRSSCIYFCTMLTYANILRRLKIRYADILHTYHHHLCHCILKAVCCGV